MKITSAKNQEYFQKKLEEKLLNELLHMKLKKIAIKSKHKLLLDTTLLGVSIGSGLKMPLGAVGMLIGAGLGAVVGVCAGELYVIFVHHHNGKIEHAIQAVQNYMEENNNLNTHFENFSNQEYEDLCKKISKELKNEIVSAYKDYFSNLDCGHLSRQWNGHVVIKDLAVRTIQALCGLKHPADNFIDIIPNTKGISPIPLYAINGGGMKKHKALLKETMSMEFHTNSIQSTNIATQAQTQDELLQQHSSEQQSSSSTLSTETPNQMTMFNDFHYHRYKAMQSSSNKQEEQTENNNNTFSLG